MKKISTTLLASIVESRRKALHMTQAALAAQTGINRSLLSRLEQNLYLPSIPQLEALGDALNFDLEDVFINSGDQKLPSCAPFNIAVAGTGYVGLSIATLLAQHNHVTAVDIVPEKVEMLNKHQSPIQDEYIEKYLASYKEVSGLQLRKRVVIKLIYKKQYTMPDLPIRMSRMKLQQNISCAVHGMYFLF